MLVFVLYFFHVYCSVKGKELAVGALNGISLTERLFPLLLIEAVVFFVSFLAVVLQLEPLLFDSPYFRSWQEIAADMILIYVVLGILQAVMIQRIDQKKTIQVLKGDSSQ